MTTTPKLNPKENSLQKYWWQKELSKDVASHHYCLLYISMESQGNGTDLVREWVYQ